MSGEQPDRASEAWIRECLNDADMNALRLALYQLTGDEALAQMKVGRRLIRGGAMYAYALESAEHERVKEKALSYLATRKSHEAPPAPSKEECIRLMNLFQDEPVLEEAHEFNYEEMAFEAFPRDISWTKDVPEAKKQAFNVVVVGGGIMGICSAIMMKRLGIPCRIVERLPSVGGTWLRNQYPMARVDTTSYLYSFKFEKNYPWSEYFASAAETLRYLHHLCDKYEIWDYFTFDTDVTGAIWNDTTSKWEVSIKSRNDGKEDIIRCNALFSAAGLLATPNVPIIDGLKDFKGHSFHSANWNHDVDLRDKEIALIGTGSTGTQMSPALAEAAKKLTIYMRTPNWISHMDGYRNKVKPTIRWLFDNIPLYWNWYSYGIHVAAQQLQFMQNVDKDWIEKGGLVSQRNDAVRQNLMEYIKEKTKSVPGLYEKCLPVHSPLCRRLVVDNGFYDTLLLPNVELVTDGIDHFDETGILDKKGTHRRHDIAVLAGGFKVSDYFYPANYIGRDGITFAEEWEKDGARSYLGLCNPGFPNFFSFYGPNHQPRAVGLYSWAECWIRYALLAVRHLIENDKKSMEVKRDVYEQYQKDLDAATKDKIWEEGLVSNYYTYKMTGRSNINCPWTTYDYHNRIMAPVLEDFVIR